MADKISSSWDKVVDLTLHEAKTGAGTAAGDTRTAH